jgi:autotransporter-associated beta strand protein
MKRNTLRMAVVLAAGAGCACGADLVWTGAAGGYWDAGLNWTNSAGAASAFAPGDNLTTNALSEIDVADITGDDAPDATFALPLADLTLYGPDDPGGFTKTGPGTLKLDSASSSFSGGAARARSKA